MAAGCCGVVAKSVRGVWLVERSHCRVFFGTCNETTDGTRTFREPPRPVHFQNERYFVAVNPTAHSLACLRIGVFVTADAARLATGVGGSPFTGRVSHPLDGKQSFMTSPHRHSPLTSLDWSHHAPARVPGKPGQGGQDAVMRSLKPCSKPCGYPIPSGQGRPPAGTE